MAPLFHLLNAKRKMFMMSQFELIGATDMWKGTTKYSARSYSKYFTYFVFEIESLITYHAWK